jgi:hypothetical protein
MLDKYSKEKELEHNIAQSYVNQTCGHLNLGWMIDHYWGLITQEQIFPASVEIYDALVKNGYDESNHFNISGDNYLWYISAKEKVFIYSSQSRDFIFIIKESELHIRKIFRNFDYDDYMADKIKVGGLKGVKQALYYADALSEYQDDAFYDKHYCYFSRPSLESYRKIDFEIPYDPEDHGLDRFKHNSYYGDFRDRGYVLSYSNPFPGVNVRVEGAHSNFTDIDYIRSTMGYLADGLDLIKIAEKCGYIRQKETFLPMVGELVAVIINNKQHKIVEVDYETYPYSYVLDNNVKYLKYELKES